MMMNSSSFEIPKSYLLALYSKKSIAPLLIVTIYYINGALLINWSKFIWETASDEFI